jgi:ATP-dependent Lhr-like helicase
VNFNALLSQQPRTRSNLSRGLSAVSTTRTVHIVQPPSQKKIHIAIEQAPYDPAPDSTPWQALAPRLIEIIERNRSIVIFVNSRRLSEVVATQINSCAEKQGQVTPIAYAHHGSLAKDVRLDVEQRLKTGVA